MIKLGAVARHSLILEGLAAALEREAPDIVLAHRAASAQQLPVDGQPCDVVLLEHDRSPAADTAHLVGSGARVLLHTEGFDPAQALAALAHGATGVLLTSEPVPVLVASLRRVAEGQAVVSDRLVPVLEALPRWERLLSPKEREVLRLYAADLPAKSVARRLGVTEGTVKEHLKRIRAKLATQDVRASTKLELRDVASTMGLLDGDPVGVAAAAIPRTRIAPGVAAAR